MIGFPQYLQKIKQNESSIRFMVVWENLIKWKNKDFRWFYLKFPHSRWHRCAFPFGVKNWGSNPAEGQTSHKHKIMKSKNLTKLLANIGRYMKIFASPF